MRGACTLREHDAFDDSLLSKVELVTLVANNVLKYRGSGLATNNYVGVFTTRRGLVVEILPKIDLGNEPDPCHETTRGLFLRMLWNWRRFEKARKLSESDIRALQRFPMLEVFVRQFLDDLNTLARGGLARHYTPVEENLPYLRGRLLFREQIRENLINQARFYAAHDELSVDRPTNRLIHSALARLGPLAREAENRRLLRSLRQLMEAADVPQSANLYADRQQYQVDRSMPHYGPVMQWVELFLFGHGLTTYSGRHCNLSLLFPMEQVFEDFVTHSSRRYQPDYNVTAQSRQAYLAEIDDQKAFLMQPDILLQEKNGKGAKFILDAKWKDLDTSFDTPKYGIDQADLYQLYAYAKGYDCNAVALVYPRSQNFRTKLQYRLLNDVTLFCLPFDMKEPKKSVQYLITVLRNAWVVIYFETRFR